MEKKDLLMSVLNSIQIRVGQKRDMKDVFQLVEGLAEYEKAPYEVSTSVEEFKRDGFGKDKVFDTFVAETDEKEIVGFALYFTAYSTWKGKSLYLEDFYVKESYRCTGLAQKIFDKVFNEAKKRKVRRFQWQVLDWNEPAIRFYKKYNAEFEDNWLNVKIRFED